MVDAFVDALRLRRWPVYLWGGPGTGKTCAAALLHACWPTESIFVRLDVLARQVGESRRNGGRTDGETDAGEIFEWWESNFWRKVDRAGLVVVDEIGTKTTGGLWQEVLGEILDRRSGRPLVATGNFGPEDLIAQQGDARVLSRLITRTGITVNCGEHDRR